MKKLLIGCGVIVLLLGVVCCGGVFWLSYSASRFLSGITEAYESIAELDERYPFEEPEGRPLDPVRLDQYLDARTQVVERLSERNAIARAILLDEEISFEEMGPVAVLRSFASLFADLGTTVEQALDSRSMSLKEVQYLVETSYLTMVLGSDMGDERFEQMLGQLSESAQNTSDTIEEQSQEEQFDTDEVIRQLRDLRQSVPPANFEIVAERREQFLEYPGVAYLEFLVLAASQGRFEE